MTEHQWKLLNPEFVLNTVEDLLKSKLTNTCIPRNSYINRVFELEQTNGQRFIAKFYRPNRWTTDMILGEHQFLQACKTQEIPVIEPLSIDKKTLFYQDNIPIALFAKKGGRVIDELNQEQWKELGRLLARVHNSGETLPDSGRLSWTPDTATTQHWQTLTEASVIPKNYQESCANAVTQFIQKAGPLFQNQALTLIHGDCHYGNIIYRPGESLYLLDFDDCVIGPAVQDLWMLLPESLENSKIHWQWFQEGYEVFRSFPETSLTLIPALKIMRQIHFAAWCAIQHKEPQFQHHFPQWGDVAYWNEWVRDIQEFNIG